MKKIVMLALFLVIVSTGGNAQVTAIRAGRVVDPETGKVASNQVILIEGTDIKAIGGDVKIPSGASVVDLSGLTVMPGMMDAHTHLCINMRHDRDAGGYYFTTLLDPLAKRAIQGSINARSMLDYGFTSVRDVGNEGNYACVEVRRAIDTGLMPGPTLITAGRIIAPYGGQFALVNVFPELVQSITLRHHHFSFYSAVLVF